MKQFHIGQILTVEIDQVDHAGIHSLINGGARGYTKRSEALLTQRVVNLHQYFSSGQKIKAKIISFNAKYETIDLSFRQAQEDPWNEYVEDLQVGEFITGQVVLLTKSKAIIEIMPGIVGVLPRSEMWMRAETVDQILMVDDWVRLQVIKIDNKEKVLTLSARGLFEGEKDSNDSQATFKIEDKLSSALQVYRWQQSKQTRRKFSLSKKFRQHFSKIYILMGRNGVAASLSEMLASFQIDIETVQVKNLETGIHDANKAVFIVECQEGEGFLPAKIRQIFPDGPMLILGTAEELTHREVDLKKLRRHPWVLKIPHSAEELIHALNSIAEGVEERTSPAQLTKVDPEPGQQNEFSRQRDLSLLLQEIKALAMATSVTVFELNLNTMETSIYASTSDNATLGEFDRGHLQFSPISDVIVDGDFVFEQGGGYHFKYMKPLGFFESLVGVKVSLSGELGYGLFFFGEKPGQFSKLDKRIFNFCELAVRAQIERQKLLETSIQKQKFILAGRLTSNFMHEIKNQMQATDYWLETMKTDSIWLNSGKIKGTDNAFMARFEQAIDGALESAKRTRGIEELFLNLLRTSEKQDILLEKFLSNFVHTIKPVVARSKIKVMLSAPKNLHIAVNVSSLNQILINLLLNSIEFMPLVRRQTGEITINAFKEKEDKLPIKIELSDNGPGINERNREKIFDLLFTTKNKGSGLGLAISRRLACDMGGSLSVKETWRLSGVTFLLELPQK